MLFKSSFMKGNNMINFIIDYSKIISGICVILFGFAIIPITYMILEASDTIIKTANGISFRIKFTLCNSRNDCSNNFYNWCLHIF